MLPLFQGSDKQNALTRLPRWLHFTIMTTCVLTMYIFYSILQERLFRVWKAADLSLGWFITLVQFIIYSAMGRALMMTQSGCASCGAAASGVWASSPAVHPLIRPPRSPRTNVPLAKFAAIAALSVATMGLSNTACEHLNYPTQLLFKSAKLVPVMLVGVVWLGKRYTALDYAAVVMLSVGLAMFSLTDKAVRRAAALDALSPVSPSPPQVSPSFEPLGVVLICSALVADALIGNFQEKVVSEHVTTPLEMVVWTKATGIPYLLLLALLTGQVHTGVQRVIAVPSDVVPMLSFSVVGLLGEICVRGGGAVTGSAPQGGRSPALPARLPPQVMALMESYGALVTVTATSCRKVGAHVAAPLGCLPFPRPCVLRRPYPSFSHSCCSPNPMWTPTCSLGSCSAPAWRSTSTARTESQSTGTSPPSTPRSSAAAPSTRSATSRSPD